MALILSTLSFIHDAGDFIDKPNEEIIKKFVDITEIEERRYLSSRPI